MTINRDEICLSRGMRLFFVLTRITSFSIVVFPLRFVVGEENIERLLYQSAFFQEIEKDHFFREFEREFLKVNNE